MELSITDVEGIVTRTISKHGIIHGLDSFSGHTVKVIIMSTPEQSPEEVYDEAETVSGDRDFWDSIREDTLMRSATDPEPQPNRAVFGKQSDAPPPAKSSVTPISEKPYSDETIDKMRKFVQG